MGKADCGGIPAARSSDMSKDTPPTFRSVWDAISDTEQEAANMKVRAELMRAIAVVIRESPWTQTEAASRCGVTQPRINDILRGRVSTFSLDALVNIATALHKRVHLQLEDCDDEQHAAMYA